MSHSLPVAHRCHERARARTRTISLLLFSSLLVCHHPLHSVLSFSLAPCQPTTSTLSLSLSCLSLFLRFFPFLSHSRPAPRGKSCTRSIDPLRILYANLELAARGGRRTVTVSCNTLLPPVPGVYAPLSTAVPVFRFSRAGSPPPPRRPAPTGRRDAALRASLSPFPFCFPARFRRLPGHLSEKLGRRFRSLPDQPLSLIHI